MDPQKDSQQTAGAANAEPKNDDTDSIVENLYKKNIEIVNKNKTLSLLSKLYEISILTLQPKELAKRVTQTVQQELSLELVAIRLFEEKSDTLTPLAFSKSERLKSSLEKAGWVLDEAAISSVKTHEFFGKVVYGKEEKITNNLQEVWGASIDSTRLQNIASESHIKTTLLYPLVIENRVLGTIMFALNRAYDSLSAFETESIKSFINVVAVALEKALLYLELQNANAQLRELDRQKDGVLHMVAHQFKGPVTTINFTSELLLDGSYGELTAEQRENVATIQAASKKMGAQSEMVLDAAKITSGKLPIEPKPVDLNALFKEIVDEGQNHAKERKVQLNISLPAATLPTVNLDKKYTQLSLDNLLNNAIKYTALKAPSGTVDFTVEIKDHVLYCTIKDNGIGIPKKDQENVFKELYRASNAGKEGNGLGLHVALGAIVAQGGKMHFESEEGKGATFFVELPLKEA